MKNLIHLWLITFALIAISSTAAAQQANDYIEVLRAEAQADKKLIISKAMRFNKQESDAFWPLYREYQSELEKINDKRLRLIEDYSKNFSSMQNEKAKQLMELSLQIEGDINVLRQKYVRVLEKKISAIMAARFLQIERQLQLIQDIEIASRVPLIEKEKAQG